MVFPASPDRESARIANLKDAAQGILVRHVENIPSKARQLAILKLPRQDSKTGAAAAFIWKRTHVATPFCGGRGKKMTG